MIDQQPHLTHDHLALLVLSSFITGITVYSPMIKFGLNPSMKFGVVGIGGLGHMAVKFGKVSDSLNEGERKRSTCMIQIDAVCVHWLSW